MTKQKLTEKEEIKRLKSIGFKVKKTPKGLIMYQHPFKLIKINNKFIPIDKQLVNLIVELNKHNIKTKFCCEGNYKKDCATIVVDLKNISTHVDFKENQLCISWQRIPTQYNRFHHHSVNDKRGNYMFSVRVDNKTRKIQKYNRILTELDDME